MAINEALVDTSCVIFHFNNKANCFIQDLLLAVIQLTNKQQHLLKLTLCVSALQLVCKGVVETLQDSLSLDKYTVEPFSKVTIKLTTPHYLGHLSKSQFHILPLNCGQFTNLHINFAFVPRVSMLERVHCRHNL